MSVLKATCHCGVVKPETGVPLTFRHHEETCLIAPATTLISGFVITSLGQHQCHKEGRPTVWATLSFPL